MAPTHSGNLQTPDMFMDGTAMEPVNIWIMPDEWNGIGILTKAWSEKATTALDPVDFLRKVSLSLDAFVESLRQAVARNRALWVQDIVQHAVSNGWDMETLRCAQEQMRDRAAREVVEIEGTLKLTVKRREAAWAARDKAHAAADKRYAEIRDDIIGPPDDPSPFVDHDRDETDLRLDPYKNARDDAKAVANRTLADALDRIEAQRDREVGINCWRSRGRGSSPVRCRITWFRSFMGAAPRSNRS